MTTDRLILFDGITPAANKKSTVETADVIYACIMKKLFRTAPIGGPIVCVFGQHPLEMPIEIFFLRPTPRAVPPYQTCARQKWLAVLF